MNTAIYTKRIGDMVELADTLHLGCNAARLGGSTPSIPTISNSSLNCYPSSKLHGTGSCTRCCTLVKKLQSKKGEVAGFLSNNRSVSLRNACHISNIFTTAYKSIHTNILQRVFLNQTTMHYCIRLATPCNFPVRVFHYDKCNSCTGEYYGEHL